MKRLLLLTAMLLGLVGVVSADIPWPGCDPCPAPTFLR